MTSPGWIRRHSPVSWALADQTVVSGVNFLTGIVLARALGVERFGAFQLIWLGVLLLGNLQMATIVQPLMSIGPKQAQSDLPAYFGSVVLQQIVFTTASCGLAVVIVSVLDPWFPRWHLGSLTLPLAAVIVTVQMQDFVRRYFFTRGRPIAAVANDALSYLGQLAVLAWLFAAGRMTIANALWSIAATSAAALAVGVAGMERLAWSRETLRSVTRRHLGFAKWLSGSALLQAGAAYYIVAAGAKVLGAAAAGALKAAQNIIGVLHVLFMGLENVVPVEASRRLHHGGRAALKSYLVSVTRWGALATGLVVLAVAWAPGFWLRLVYGDEYAVFGSVLRWYAVIYLMAFFGTPMRAFLRAREHTRPLLWAALGMLVVGLATAYPFSRWWGLSGTMTALLGAHLALQGTLAIAVWRKGRQGERAPS